MKIATLLSRLSVRQLILHYFFLNATVLGLGGCTTSLTQVDLARLDAPPAGKATILVIRPHYLSYAARDLIITANNSAIADLINASYTSFLMPPGSLKLSSEGGFFSWPRREITIPVEAGQTYYLSWVAKETASSALMMYLFPNMNMDSLHWEMINQKSAQSLLNSTHHVRSETPELSK
ncbi:MAG: DUF2846 domain-containing protein [Gallionella sp.]